MIDVRSFLQSLINVHNFNDQKNMIEIKKNMLINVDPLILLNNTKQIKFKRKNRNFGDIARALFTFEFVKKLFFVTIISCELEGCE